ncbi:hypothetical protein SME36J_34290 [Serratia marcescens]|nr:hypothetical protein SME36J_34290 [Serratia marcescens]
MNASDYLKQRLKADRKIALALDKGIVETVNSMSASVENIYLGAERGSWYLSCFFDRYADTCNELKQEDIRMALAIAKIYKRRDVIFDMFHLYFEYVLKDISEENINGAVRNTVTKVAGVVSSVTSSQAARKGIAYTAAKTLASSGLVTSAMRAKLSDRIPIYLKVAQTYGLQQKAAFAARRLKSLDAGYYWILYANKIEMLYFFIDPILSKIIIRIKSNANIKEEEIKRIINEAINV